MYQLNPLVHLTDCHIFVRFCSGLFQKKKYLGGGGGGGGAGDIFFFGWLVRKVFKLYGSLVFNQI